MNEGMSSTLRARMVARYVELRGKLERIVGSRDDAADAIRLVLTREGSAGEIYNVVDDQPILQSECYGWLAAKLNRPLPLTGRSASKRKRGDSDKRVSNAKLRAIGWTPRYPNFAEGMEKSVLLTFDDEGA